MPYKVATSTELAKTGSLSHNGQCRVPVSLWWQHFAKCLMHNHRLYVVLLKDTFIYNIYYI
jgi:hypothetical protein